MLDPNTLIAHRGEMRHFPENTLPAIQAALAAGARHIEIDVQLSRNGIPVIFHDLTLERLCGRTGEIRDYSSRELNTIRAVGAPHRHEDFPHATIPTLEQFIKLLNHSPLAHVFVELKRHSIEPFGLKLFVETVIEALSGAEFPWTLISFRDDVIYYAKLHHQCSIGWVLREHNQASRKIAETLLPDYLMSNIVRIPANRHSFWPGPWKWAVYDIDNKKDAMTWLQRGADLIETCCITDLLDD